MTISVAQVERELVELRAETALATDADRSFPEVRASIATLVVWAEREERARAAVDISVEVAARNPCRTIVCIPGDGPVGADISVRCFLAPASEHQVCCEQVALHGGSAAQVASAAEQLLLPDLRVLLWCLTDRLPAAAGRLLDAANRLIVDSHYADDPFAAARWIAAEERGRGMWVVDLEWARLSPWRRQLAHGFDGVAPVGSASVVQVEDGVRAYLMAGWLIDRLALAESDVEILSVPAGDGLHAGHLMRVTLDGKGGSLTVDRRPGCEWDRARALSDELEQPGQDETFTAALRRAVALLPADPAPTPHP